MKAKAQDDVAAKVTELLKDCPNSASGLILAGNPATIQPEDVAAVEQYLYVNAPAHASLEKLREGLSAMVGLVSPEAAKTLGSRAVFSYPKAWNPFAGGVQNPDLVYRQADRWFAVSFAAWNERRTPCSRSEEAAVCFKLFLLSAVLEFAILDSDYIPALARSLERTCELQQERSMALHRTLTAVPLTLPAGSVQQAEERLFVAGENTNTLLKEFFGHPQRAELLSSLTAGSPSGSAEMCTRLERMLPETYHFPAAIAFPSLIEDAYKVAILRMPPAVAAHRGREFVSHSLRLDVFKRIGDYNLAPHDRVKSSGQRSSSGNGDETATPGTSAEWMIALRAALPKNKQIDKQALKKLAQGEDRFGRVLSNYALWLSARSGSKTVRRYAFLIAARLLPRFDPADQDAQPAGPDNDRDAWITRIDDDTWEEVIEQVLDEDEFFRRADVAESDTRRRRGHSQQLLSALHSFIRYLGRGNKNFAELHEKIPAAGPMRVDANLATVDEYKAALRWLGSVEVYPDVEMIEASRVALILGYRCGLRRAESGYLRLGDFDDADFLHVRPTKMRKLKTSNARRDLPLALLIPADELRLVKRRITKIRTRAEAALKAAELTETSQNKKKSGERTWRDALLFPTRKDPFRAGDFEAIVGRVGESVRAPKRDFPADKDFHYHVLRHSFANMMLLKLWPALHPVARRILHRQPETLEWICGCEKFRLDLFGTDAIRGSDLQAIALLMGHGSSATTLEHYLHVLDWYRPGGSESTGREAADEDAAPPDPDVEHGGEIGTNERHME